MAGRERCARRGKEGGAAAVEFALVLPVLLLLVFGIVQYGLYFWAMQGGSDIARDAARRAAVGDYPDCQAFRTHVEDEVDSLLGVDETRLVTVVRDYAADGPVAIGDQVSVRVEFTTIDLNMPMLPFIDDGRVVSQATARVDYLPAQPQGCS